MREKKKGTHAQCESERASELERKWTPVRKEHVRPTGFGKVHVIV